MKRQVNIPRQMSLVTPEVVNPFVHKLELESLDILKIILMSVTLAPLRLLLIIVLLLAAWSLATVSLAFRSEEEKKKPLSGWRNMLRPLIVGLCRSVFVAGGFNWIVLRGIPANGETAPVFVLAPHSAFMDALVVVYLGLSTVVAKHHLENVTIFGTLIEFTQPVLVKREDPNSRQNTIKEIQRRAQSGGQWPQIIIFPEGTCTNGRCLINFKPGAFYPGVPVQPVCIRYLNKINTYAWTYEGPGVLTILWLTLCQINNVLALEFLPVYVPSEEEKKDAKLFANNVRQKMAECLNVPTTDHSFEDCRLMLKAAKLKLPKSAVLIEFVKLNRKLGVKFDDLNVLLDKFCTIAKKKDGKIQIEQFAEYLQLPVSDTLHEVFNMYDRDGSGTIDFREYVIGLCIVSSPVNTEETIKLAFELFDDDQKGFITEEELTTILHNAFNMNEVDSQKLFNDVDEDKDGKISYEEFRNYSLRHPEYAKLFTTYQAKKMENINGDGHAKMD